MALANIYKSYRLSNYIHSILRSFVTFTTVRGKSVLVDLDVLDDFTTQLMQKKADKWEYLKIKSQLPAVKRTQLVDKNILGNKLMDVSTNELNLVFERFLDESDQNKIYALLEECIVYRRCPSELILTNILSMYAQSAHTEGIGKVQELCSTMNKEYLRVNSNLKHLLAEAMWVKGNVLKSIDIFEEVYKENPFLRRKIRLILRYLIMAGVPNCSEAVLVNLIAFSEKLSQNYKDYYVMACVWQTCFLSEWFSDQQVALELIEKNVGLRKAIAGHIPYVIGVSLRQHKTDSIYRLLEILLKCEMKLQSSIVLVALFDYRFRQGDLSSCCEILNWSSKHKILLPSVQHEKFLRLLLKIDGGERKEKHQSSRYEFKF